MPSPPRAASPPRRRSRSRPRERGHSREESPAALPAIARIKSGCMSSPRTLKLQLVCSLRNTSHIPARSPPTLPHHSPHTSSVLRRRRFDLRLQRRRAELPSTAPTSELLLFLPLLSSRSKVRQRARSVQGCCPQLSTSPRHRQPHHMHRTRTLRKTGGDPSEGHRPYHE